MSGKSDIVEAKVLDANSEVANPMYIQSPQQDVPARIVSVPQSYHNMNVQQAQEPYYVVEDNRSWIRRNPKKAIGGCFGMVFLIAILGAAVFQEPEMELDLTDVDLTGVNLNAAVELDVPIKLKNPNLFSLDINRIQTTVTTDTSTIDLTMDDSVTVPSFGEATAVGTFTLEGGLGPLLDAFVGAITCLTGGEGFSMILEGNVQAEYLGRSQVTQVGPRQIGFDCGRSQVEYQEFLKKVEEAGLIKDLVEKSGRTLEQIWLN